MILVTGGSGVVGSAVAERLRSREVAFTAPSRSEFDLNQPHTLSSYLNDLAPTRVVHLGADTNVDGCESDPGGALRRNFESTELIAAYCGDRDVPLTFVSTSAVLAATPKLMHSEIDDLAPVNFYAQTKAAAEEAVRRSCRYHLVIRASWMLGRGAAVRKFGEVMLERVSRQEEVQAVFDKFGSLTSANRLADTIVDALEERYRHTIHCASATPCSRYDVAKQMARFLGVQASVVPVSSAHFPAAAPRGLSEGLTSDMAQSLLGYRALTWEDELFLFVSEMGVQP